MRNRRDRIAVVVALSAVVIASSCSGSHPAQSGASLVGIHKIQHIVVIMQENRSFDSYFGTYPGADGIPTAKGKPAACVPDVAGARCVRPYPDHFDVNRGGPHGHPAAVQDVNGTRMNGFVLERRKSRGPCDEPTNPDCVESGSAKDVMGYHTGSDLPNYWTYAHDFVLQDHMFEPDDSWSLPAHLFMVSAWSADCTRHNDPGSCRNAIQTPGIRPRTGNPLDPTSYKAPIYAWTDLTYLLHAHGVSWNYYVVPGVEPDCRDPATLSCAPVAAEPQNPGHLESAAVLRHGADRPPARQHPIRSAVLRRCEERRSTARRVGRSVGRGERAPAGACQ